MSDLGKHSNKIRESNLSILKNATTNSSYMQVVKTSVQCFCRGTCIVRIALKNDWFSDILKLFPRDVLLEEESGSILNIDPDYTTRLGCRH